MQNYVPWITSADEVQIDAEVLTREWASRHGNSVVTTAELLSIVERTGAFRWVLTKPTPEGRLVALGRKVLIPLVNRPVAGWIVRRATSGSSATYRLERLIAVPAPPLRTEPAPGDSDGHWFEETR